MASADATMLSSPEKHQEGGGEKGGEKGGESKVEVKFSHSQKEGEIRHSNPFLADGVLSKKADYILTHSTITRTELHIADPDLISERETAAQQQKTGLQGSAGNDPPRSPGGTKPPEGTGGLNGPPPSTGTVAVEAEVRQSTVTGPNQQKAEEVKLKNKKCKCCVVQ